MVTRGTGSLRVCLDCAEAGRSSTVRQQRADRAEAYGHNLVDHAPDPAPAKLLGELLRYDREFGVPFAEAWASSVEFVLERVSGRRNAQERASWAEAFRCTRSAWQAAWRGQTDGPGSTLTPVLLDAFSGEREACMRP
jgi:hypothetical protein